MKFTGPYRPICNKEGREKALTTGRGTGGANGTALPRVNERARKTSGVACGSVGVIIYTDLHADTLHQELQLDYSPRGLRQEVRTN